MTGAEVGLWTTAGGVALAGIIKFGTWVFETRAKVGGERRADLTTIIARQDDEINALRKEIQTSEAECERKISVLEGRVDRAETARAQMEGVLYRMGWDRSPEGKWTRNGSTT